MPTAALYPFMAAGEEKTTIQFPPGFGYPIGANDTWILNYMIHNLTAKPRTVYITYDMDFVPETSPLASSITPVHPIWMDVEDHHIYPVFDVHRGSGKNGKFTFPDMAKNPYGGGAPLNEFTVDHPGTLIGTAGHLHPGGLYDDLNLTRPGVRPAPANDPRERPGLSAAVPLGRRLLGQGPSARLLGRVDDRHARRLATPGPVRRRAERQRDLRLASSPPGMR